MPRRLWNLPLIVALAAPVFAAGSATFPQRVLAAPADLSTAQIAGYTAPVNASNTGFNVITEPSTLNGNVQNTTVSWYLQNTGAQAATGFNLALRLDGSLLNNFSGLSIAPGSNASNARGPVLVRGGRHTLSYMSDDTNVIAEASETNNNFGRQLVWSPLAMTDGVPLTRAMPPDPAGGLAEVPGAAYPNVDGLRASLPARSYACLATAVVPGAGSDVDLEWFNLSTGPSNGFETPLASSERGADLTELLVECRSGARSNFDIGVRKYAGTTQSYTIQTAQSPSGSLTDPGTLGPATIPPGEIIEVFQFTRNTNLGTMTVYLENLAGSADLGMSIYKFGTAQPPGNINSALPGGSVDAGGPGSSEKAVINQNLSAETIGIVVWKSGSPDLARNSTFRLLIDPAVSDAGATPPPQLAFAVNGGNPLSSNAQLQFTLPAPRDVSLDVLNVLGRHVRTLLRGPQSAGSHSIGWDGADDQGTRLANGTYFVRFASDDFKRVIKVSVMR